MKMILRIAAAGIVSGIVAAGCGRDDDRPPASAGKPRETAPPGASEFEVEAACGECKFGLAGTSCDLAVRIEGKAYFVVGSAIDDHGDAHAADGLCNAIRRAMVSGAIKDDRFVATSFRLLP